MKTHYLTLVLLALCGLSQISNAQIYLGQDEMPAPESIIEDPVEYGGPADYSGGYNVGDQVANFQAFTPEGEVFRLSQLIGNGKYTIISSGSITCSRFQQAFNQDWTSNPNTQFRDYAFNHVDDFNWVFVYSFEAHPADVENCLSNCNGEPVLAPNGDSLFQHTAYEDRLNAITLWEDIIEDPSLNYEMPFNFVADNPDGRIYNNYFGRPFGVIVVDCAGKVIARGDWTAHWFHNHGGSLFLDDLLETGWNCESPAFGCDPEAIDTDNDGICDDQEMWQGWDQFDENDPYVQIDDASEDEVNNPTSVDQFTGMEWSIYPNPVESAFTITGLLGTTEVEILTLTGRKVFQETLQREVATILTDEWNSGIYLVKITSLETGKVEIKKVTRI